jgi:hypothetical protein
MPRSRPAQDVRAVFELKAAGLTDREISQTTGVPLSTIRAWRNRGISARAARALGIRSGCPSCGDEEHDFTALPAETYAYLLGVYLGDGYLGRHGGSWTLRVYLDAAYPGIVGECCDAIAAIRGTRPKPTKHHTDRCVSIQSCWRSWPCFFPQHGPGRKHKRRIQLAEWQQDIVDAAPGAFLRGLIHTDGWRGLNRVFVKGKNYEYPRYQFSNRSNDIRKLFTDTCDKLGVQWRRWTRYHISVARRESVAILDAFVGPKY